MAKIGRSISATVCLVILLLLLAPRDEASRVEEEKRVCESQSHRFKGRCMSKSNCGLVCRNEGFTGGNCRGVRGRCFCTKPC